MDKIMDYLRSAAAHPDGHAVLQDRALRDEAIEAGLVVPVGYGVVAITDKGREASSAEAAQPVAWMWPDAFERLMRGDSPRETAHAATSTPDSVPLYAAQPQGELREALELLEKEEADSKYHPQYIVGLSHAINTVRAALAGRTAE